VMMPGWSNPTSRPRSRNALPSTCHWSAPERCRDQPRSVPAEPYEVPRIEARDPIDDPLIGGPGLASPPVGASAAFRSVPPRPYTAPRIVARDPLDVPLIGAVGSVVDALDNGNTSAAFRTDQITEE
jgi:hypothetical protein